MNIIVNLDVVLAKRKMTLTELSEEVGITIANLSVLKNGKAKAIRFSTLEKICEALDCQPCDILAYDKELIKLKKFVVLFLYEAYIRKCYLSAFVLLVLVGSSLLDDAFINSDLNVNGMIQTSLPLVSAVYVLIFTGFILAIIIKVVTYIKTRKYI